MATIDEELLLDDEENARELAFIREQLPAELKDKYSDDDLLYDEHHRGLLLHERCARAGG